MTRRSRRELEHALEDLTLTDTPDSDPCDECGGAPDGTDARQGVTAEFATLECTCGSELPEGAQAVQPGDGT